MRGGFVLAFDERNQVDPVERGILRQSGERDGRGGDVEADDRFVVDGAGGQVARPGRDERRADAAFGEHAFLADQRRVQGAVPGFAQRGAVVTDEEDQGVLVLSHRLELGAQLAEAFVHRRHHRQRLAAFLGEFCRRLGKPRFGGFERHVRGVVSEVEEEGLVRFGGTAIQEGQGGFGLDDHAEAVVGDEVRRVGEGSALQVVRGVELTQLPAEVFVEALGVGHVFLRDSECLLALLAAHEVEMPLADLSGDVTGSLEALGEGELLERQRPLVVILDAEALLIAPGQHAGAGGDALGG